MTNSQMQALRQKYIIRLMKVKGILIKSLIFLILLFLGYYFFSKFLIEKEKNLALHYSNLVQNKVAYINLTKLDPKDPAFDTQKSDLIGIIKETNKNGLENPINDQEKETFMRQGEILTKVYATKSYEEGVAILKSPESVTNLADQTKLIQELNSQIQKLREFPLLRLGWR